MGQFPTLAVSAGDGIVPCGLITEIAYLGIFRQDFYGPFLARLHEAGYRDNETLFIFDYDWRLSILDNAARLAEFVDTEIPDGQFDVLGHSMGGLIARAYAVDHAGTHRIARMLSAGSPWLGSVQVFELLAGGWGLATPLFGGLETFRRTIVSFPSTFELMPSYEGCCDGPDAGFDAGSAEDWASLRWTGIGSADLPDLASGRSRRATLRAIVEQPLPAGIEEALVIGVDQRTTQHFVLHRGDGEAQMQVATSWEGDGTVMRDSAVLPQRAVYPTSFALHDALLNDPDVQDFVLTALTQGPKVATQTIAVRERTSILTALGDLVELVGVAVVADQPAYAAGSNGRVVVHVRLGAIEPIDPGTLRLTIAQPGRAATEVPLAADPVASDPTNPFEQSFSAPFQAGDIPGDLLLTVTLESPGQPARIVTSKVPVLRG